MVKVLVNLWLPTIMLSLIGDNNENLLHHINHEIGARAH